MIRTACCSICGTRVELQTYTGLERVLCDRCKKIEEVKEQAANVFGVDCGKCESRECER